MTSGCYDRRDVCGYYRLRPAPAGIPGRDVRGILEAGRRLRLCGQQKMPICRSLMERTGIEPVTSGLQILCGDSPSVPIGLGSSLMAGSRRLGLAGGCRRLAARAFHERSRMTSRDVLLPRSPRCRALIPRGSSGLAASRRFRGDAAASLQGAPTGRARPTTPGEIARSALDGFRVWVTDEPNENETLCHSGRLEGREHYGTVCHRAGGMSRGGAPSQLRKRQKPIPRGAARSRQWGRPSIHRSAGR
jgi:hypothetical protein